MTTEENKNSNISENEIETNDESKINNAFNKLKLIQSLLKKESALKNLYLNSFENIQNDINKICREIYEQKLKAINIIKSGENPNVVFIHQLVENNKEYMKELYLYIPKLIEHIWNNPSLIAKLLINSNENDIKQYLAPLICDNFYENILSPNYLEDQLVLVIYILLENEINNLKDVNDSKNFLENTSCSFLLNQLISKKDIKEFFRIVLKDTIENFETSSGDTKLILEPSKIEKIVTDRKRILKKKYFNKKNEKKVEEIDEEKNSQIIEEEKKINEIFFGKYSIDMSIKNLKNEIKNLDEKLLEQLIKIQQLENENEDNNIFSNLEFFNLMNTNSDNAHDILKEYESNFLKLINFLDSIFEVIIENLDLLPFSIKCICKLISILLEKKFPNINEIEKYSFISKFIFNNLLVPVLINPAQGALINNYIISNNTMFNMNVATDIIKRFTSFIFYNPKKDTILSPFNNFFIRNFDKLTKINEVAIKTKIPAFIEKVIEGKIEINSKYDFFNENNNEILYNRSIFLSMNHIKVIMKGIMSLLNSEDNYFKKIVSKIIDNKENMQYLIELADQNEKIVKNTVKNEKGKGKITRNEQTIKYFLMNDIVFNEKYKNILNNNDTYTYFKLQEKKIHDNNNTKDVTENLIIKTKNLISASLSNYRILDEITLGTENITNTFDILKKLKYYMKSTNYVVDEGIPSEWYIGLLLENLQKLPEEYKKNDYEKLYEELEKDIKNSMGSRNFELLSVIVAKMRFSKRRKDFYSHLTDVLIDINLNNNVNNIIENDEINVKLYFKYGEKKKLNIYKEDLSERQLDFLNSFVFVDDKDVKSCKTIKSFTNTFPDLNRCALVANETKSVFDIQKELNVPKEIDAFFTIIKNHLTNVRKIKDEKELNLIYNKIYDHVWSKIYSRLYPNKFDIMDMSLQQKFTLYSWVEPYHFIKDNNYNFELILPKIVNYFNNINIEKSPRKKIMNMNFIFEAINTLLEFNQDKINIGVDNQMPLLNYVFIKAKPKNIFTNCEFMGLYSGDKIRKKEGNYLTQLKSIRDFTLSLTHNKLFNITIDEFNQNCKLAVENKDK